MSDLLPCPFCGAGQEELFVDTSYAGFVVSCENCTGRASQADWESRSELTAQRMAQSIVQLERQLRAAQEALVQHNDRLRSAISVASRDAQ